MKIIPIMSSILLIGFATQTALAREVPKTDQIIKKLQPKQKTRSFGRGITVKGGKKTTAKPSINLYISFQFNSARLSTDARITLRNLGRALKDPRLAQYRFMIAGHTDAVGSDVYNQTLSEKRANAVRDHLISTYAVAGGRLEAKGHGESQLLDSKNPRSGANRRVQIVNLGSGS